MIKIRALSLLVLMALVLYILLDEAGIVKYFNDNIQIGEEISWAKQK